MDLRSRSNDRTGCPGRGLFETPQSRQGWLAQIFILGNASVRVEADDRAGLERLLRYCARPPFALERLEAIDAHRLMYHLSKPQYESAPLACPQCGADMQIIAFVTESVSVRRILEHIGEPADPPRIAPARGPPAWEEDAEPVALLDSLTQPDPDFQFDQTVSW